MFIDARKTASGTSIEADICVVGAGAAGITFARQFAGSSVKLCLLESGGLEFDQETQSLYGGEVRGRDYYDLTATRLRYFGGTTNHWAGWARPLDEIDFEERSFVPHSGWPIARGDVEPYYPRAHKICRLGPFDYRPVAFSKMLPALYRTPLRDERGVRRIWRRSDPIVLFGLAYRDDIANARNIHCYLHANLLAIETNDSVSAVTGLRVACLNGVRFHVAAKIFVLACGGIENARLLLLANAQRPAGLGNDFDQVGRYFMLHPQLPVGDVLAVGSSADLYRPGSEPYPSSLRAGISLSAARQRAEGLPNYGVLFEPAKHGSRGFKTFRRLWSDPFGSERDHSVLDDLRAILGDLDGIARKLYERATGKEGEVLGAELRMEHAPNPDSRISLSPERDRFGLNQAVVDWRFSPWEKAAVRRTVQIVGEIIGGRGAGRLRIADWLAADDDRWTERLSPDHHHMGTTRMSTSPRSGVVTSDCRVHGVTNLYVAGSSVFATAGFSNPTLTIVALSLRLADHVKRVLGRA